MELFNGILRIVQLICVAVILGLSATLVKGQFFGNPPALTDYALFCGVWGFLVAAIGILALFVDALAGIVLVALDGLATLFFVAAGIALAVQLKARSCSYNQSDIDNGYTWLSSNSLINGGLYDGKFSETVDLVGRCRMAQADTAFIFFGFAAFAGSLILDVLHRRGGGRGLSHV